MIMRGSGVLPGPLLEGASQFCLSYMHSGMYSASPSSKSMFSRKAQTDVPRNQRSGGLLGTLARREPPTA